jgi:hypothetical protein
MANGGSPTNDKAEPKTNSNAEEGKQVPKQPKQK